MLMKVQIKRPNYRRGATAPIREDLGRARGSLPLQSASPQSCVQSASSTSAAGAPNDTAEKDGRCVYPPRDGVWRKAGGKAETDRKLLERFKHVNTYVAT